MNNIVWKDIYSIVGFRVQVYFTGLGYFCLLVSQAVAQARNLMKCTCVLAMSIVLHPRIKRYIQNSEIFCPQYFCWCPIWMLGCARAYLLGFSLRGLSTFSLKMLRVFESIVPAEIGML